MDTVETDAGVEVLIERAEQRDLRAERRDRLAEERDSFAGIRGGNGEESASDRASAARDRHLGAKDRDQAASDRADLRDAYKQALGRDRGTEPDLEPGQSRDERGAQHTADD